MCPKDSTICHSWPKWERGGSFWAKFANPPLLNMHDKINVLCTCHYWEGYCIKRSGFPLGRKKMLYYWLFIPFLDFSARFHGVIAKLRLVVLISRLWLFGDFGQQSPCINDIFRYYWSVLKKNYFFLWKCGKYS